MRAARVAAVICGTLGFLSGAALDARADVPIVSVWYRGTPAGVPQPDDLALIRALGFAAISWPSAHATRAPAVRQLAKAAGLEVVIEADDPVPANGSEIRTADRVRILAHRLRASDVPAPAWTAIARGLRFISFDGGAVVGHGLAGLDGAERPWVRPAVTFARQVWANAELLGALQPGPAVTFLRPAPGITVSLMSTPRTWILIAANADRRARDLDVRLPAHVPYALWVSLFDGSTMSMLSEPTGPRWELELAAGQAAVYFTDRAPDPPK